MAIPKIKATYSLDPSTVRALERTARRWGVSKSEVLRRAIRAAAERRPVPSSEGLAALDRLQHALGLRPEAARRWARQVRAERRASSARREADGV